MKECDCFWTHSALRTLATKLRKKCGLALLFILPVFASAEGAHAPGLGMWVWPQEAFETTNARKKLLKFCGQEGISHLDQHISFANTENTLTVKNQDALVSLVTTAGKQGITVNVLRGSKDMFFRGNHKKTLEELRAIISFDENLPSGTHLAGVKYDVEPYGTAEWKAGGGSRRKVIIDYLTFLQEAKRLLKREAPHLNLAVDVPFWWDDEKFSVRFNGVDKLLIEHVQDLTDYICIMSYRTNAKEVLECIRHEQTYAGRIGKTICAGLETGNVKGAESWISFRSHPKAVFRKTVSELQQKLSGDQTVRSIMLHHYNSLFSYLKNEE